MSCQFCGSKDIRVKTPFVELARSGKYEPRMTYCCKAQRENAEYVDKRFGRGTNDRPKVEEVGKL